MATVTKKVKKVKTIILELDEKEAGYLLDLLRGHVAGTAIHGPDFIEDGARKGPLGRIGDSLFSAGIKRYYAKYEHDDNLLVTLPEYDKDA